jgi:hypothetical protein
MAAGGQRDASAICLIVTNFLFRTKYHFALNLIFSDAPSTEARGVRVVPNVPARRRTLKAPFTFGKAEGAPHVAVLLWSYGADVRIP